ncbi:MAG TPA: phosphopantetheine-binding protein [Candidatus Eisenbacteria bacterium]|nr:phosphopantetheine-binding protein [Candidatus Eisenbacteria bacterium]
MTRAERATALRAFLRTIQKPGLPVEGLGEDEGLVTSGLIDSLAILEIVTWLEERFGIDFATLGLDPGELRSIGSILDLIGRETS